MKSTIDRAHEIEADSETGVSVMTREHLEAESCTPHGKGWVYFFGTLGRKGILSGQLSKIDLILLAAIHGTRTHERLQKVAFADLKDDSNSTESFNAAPRLVEYVNWLREQWWTALAEDDEDLSEEPSWNEWMPLPERRSPLRESDPDALLQRCDAFGPLMGTPWASMSTPEPEGNDFYTPADIVNAARQAMCGIDLDPASHWRANRVHKIPKYYHQGRSAFDNPWAGRIWLNPPYGDNRPWFEQIIRYWDTGEISQLCMLSPVWVFSARQAAPIIARSSAMVLLTPTPTFWGQPQGRTGTNHPHMILYMGDRVAHFHVAFKPFGIPFSLIEAIT